MKSNIHNAIAIGIQFNSFDNNFMLQNRVGTDILPRDQVSRDTLCIYVGYKDIVENNRCVRGNQ